MGCSVPSESPWSDWEARYGTIQVSLRILDDCAEVDVLQTNQGETIRNTRPASSPNGGPSALVRTPAADGQPGPSPNGAAATRTPRSGGSFAEWLADALRREGMTMEAAARQLKVSVKTVSRWVRGATEPRLGDLSRIREIFGDVPFP